MAEPQTERPNGEKVNWKMGKGAILSLFNSSQSWGNVIVPSDENRSR